MSLEVSVDDGRADEGRSREKQCQSHFRQEGRCGTIAWSKGYVLIFIYTKKGKLVSLENKCVSTQKACGQEYGTKENV